MASPRKKKTSPSEPAALTPALSTGDGFLSRPVVHHAGALVLLTMLSFAFFAPIHFSGKALIAFDTVSWRSMAESMLAEEEATGDEALWATNPFGGMPGYLISAPAGVPQVDNVPALLRKVIWPSSHFLFLLTGAYVLAFLITGGVGASVFAASAYGLTTYMPVILAAGHNSKFIALAFAPWLVAAFVFALRRPGALSGLLFAIALAANLRAGHIQITYYMVWIIGLWWLVEGVAAMRSAERAGFLKATGWLAAGGVLGILMVAHPYLVISEYKNYTIRGAEVGGVPGTMDWTYAMGWSQGVGELLTLLIADAFGGSEAYWGPKSMTGGPHYVGGLVLVFALLALWRHRSRPVLALGIAAVVMTLFSLGEHFALLNRLMYAYFPLFDAFRVPETWLSAVALTLAALAAVGVHETLRTTDAGPLWRQPAFQAFAGVALFVVVLIVGQESLLGFERPNEYETLVERIASGNNITPDDPRVGQTARQFLAEASVQRREMFQGDALRTLVFLLLGLGVVVLTRRQTMPVGAGALLLALLVVVDLWGVDRRYLGEDNLVDGQRAEDRVATYDFDRFILDRVAEAGGPGAFRTLSLEGSPVVTARPAFHYETLGGYHGAKLRLYQDYLENLLFNPATGTPYRNALDLLGVRYVVSGFPIPGLEPVYTGEQTGYRVYEKKDVAPRAYFVGNVEVEPEHEALWRRLVGEGLELTRTALVGAPLDLAPAPIDSASVATVERTAFSSHELAWTVETDRPRLLVVSEVYYPAGWKATIDGAEAPIHQVNYLVRGVVVPAGRHTVTMTFDPPRVRIGYLVSLIATLLAYGGVVAVGVVGRLRAGR